MKSLKIIPKLQKPKTILFGINNPNHMCYMISILQMLFSVKEFTEYILDNNFFFDNLKEIYGKKGKLEIITKDYYFFYLNEILMSKNRVKNINNFMYFFETKNKIGNMFTITRQNDAGEFLEYFLNDLHNEFYRIENYIHSKVRVKDIEKQESFISYYFQINNSITIKPPSQDQSTEYVMIPKDIERDTQYKPNDYLLNIPIYKINKKINLQDLINIELAPEIIHETASIEKNSIMKRKITSLPKYLIIRILRFKFKGADVDETIIKIPKSINIYDRYYDIISIVCYGGSGSGGHYTTYSERNDEWYYFNDSSVTKTCLTDVFKDVSSSGKPYIILCRLVDLFKRYKPIDKRMLIGDE